MKNFDWVFGHFFPQVGFAPREFKEHRCDPGVMHSLHVDQDEALRADVARRRKKFYLKDPEELYTNGKPKDLVDLFR